MSGYKPLLCWAVGLGFDIHRNQRSAVSIWVSACKICWVWKSWWWWNCVSRYHRARVSCQYIPALYIHSYITEMAIDDDTSLPCYLPLFLQAQEARSGKSEIWHLSLSLYHPFSADVAYKFSISTRNSRDYGMNHLLATSVPHKKVNFCRKNKFETYYYSAMEKIGVGNINVGKLVRNLQKKFTFAT